MDAEEEEKRRVQAEEEDKERRRAKLRWMLARIEDLKKGCSEFEQQHRVGQLQAAIAAAEGHIPSDDPPTHAALAVLHTAIEAPERILRTMTQVAAHLQRLHYVELALERLMGGNPDPPDEDTAYDVTAALDDAANAYSDALSMVAQSTTQSALTQAEAEAFEVIVSKAEDALQIALQAAKAKVSWFELLIALGRTRHCLGLHRCTYGRRWRTCNTWMLRSAAKPCLQTP